MIRGSNNLEHAVKRMEKHKQSPIPVHVQQKIDNTVENNGIYENASTKIELKGKS